MNEFSAGIMKENSDSVLILPRLNITVRNSLLYFQITRIKNLAYKQ